MPFEPQPTWRGALVELTPLRPDAFGALYAVAAGRLIWEQHPARDRHLEPVSRQFFDETLASRGALLATDAATRRAIGSSRFLFFVSPGNFRSQRAVEKVGGELEPERDAEGRLVYRITASAFARREAQQGPPLARS